MKLEKTKKMTRIRVVWTFICTLALATTVAGRTQEEIRAVLNGVLATEYCGSAMVDGMDAGTAIRGESPVEGMGFVQVEESEWRPVLLEMAENEWEHCLPSIGEDWDEALLDRETSLFRRMLVLLGCSAEADAGVDELMDRVVQEMPCKSLAWNIGVRARTRRALRRQETGRCVEFGEWVCGRWGNESPEHYKFLASLFDGMELCRTDGAKKEIVDYLLDCAGRIEKYGCACVFDMHAEDCLPGWKGSVQRRRLAERFKDEPVHAGTLVWDEKREKYVSNPVVSPNDAAQMLWSRAAAELAADEEALTDLREVYGEW